MPPSKKKSTKSTTAKNTAPRKTTRKKTTTRKTSTQKTAAKMATKRKTTPKKTAAKRTTTRKTTPKKTAAKRTTTRKTTPQKTAAKRTTTRKTTPKKTAIKDTATKNKALKKTAVKRTPARKTSPKKTTTRNKEVEIFPDVKKRNVLPLQPKKQKTCNKCTLFTILISAVLIAGALIFLAFHLGKTIDEKTLQTAILQGIEDYVAEQEMIYQEENLSPSFIDQDLSGDAPFLGNPDASVTMIGFSDYQCEFSKQFHKYVFPFLMENYVSEGTVKFVHRNMPLDFHEHTYPAALISACVRDQKGNEEFFVVHDYIFETMASGFDIDKTVEFALDNTGVEASELVECIEGEKMKDVILEDIDVVKEAGFAGTPTFVINGMVVVGAEPVEVFEAYIEEALASLSSE